MKQLLRGISRTAPLPLTALAAPAAAFFLSAAALGGQFSPWTLAAVAVSGTGWSGLASVACALLGALAFLDFQPGLRLGAAALLIFCANTSFCTTRLYRCAWFRPLAAVLASSLVQTAYLWQRGGRQWALWCASLALLYGCALRADCWQSHYTDTYNAFNDACPRLLRRGKPLAEDFPAYFAARCIRFPQLLSALEEQLRGFLQRRAHHARLDAAYRLAREQYAQVSQLLTRQEAEDAPARPRYVCRTALATRPKKGEALCGDEAACFAVGDRTYLLLSDGMGSGDSAHHEAAMTVRLLRQFLTAGIHAAPALKTLNTALMLRCQGGAGFTTIDLACMDSASGVVTLYKYGAAPSYLKKSGTVTRLAGSALPAGLESADRDPQPQRLTLSPGHWLVLVSDGVTGDSDEWLQDLLAGWDGTSPRQLVSLILREAEDRWHGDDDCAVLALRAERLGDGKKRV